MMLGELTQVDRLILKNGELVAILCSPSEGEPASTDHLDWPKAMMNGERMVEADSCLQLCQSLFGEEWQVMIRAMPVLLAWQNGGLGVQDVKIALNIVDTQTLLDIRQKAIAAGVKLARGGEE